eukprot:2809821-Rhodomonas_salina.4
MHLACATQRPVLTWYVLYGVRRACAVLTWRAVLLQLGLTVFDDHARNLDMARTVLHGLSACMDDGELRSLPAHAREARPDMAAAARPCGKARAGAVERERGRSADLGARALRCVRLTHPIPPRAAPLAAPPDLLAVGRKGGLREGGGKCALERGPAQRARVLERRQPHCPRHPSGLYPLPSLRARYAMSGSHVAYPPVAPYGAAMPCPVKSAICLRVGHCLVLILRILLPAPLTEALEADLEAVRLGKTPKGWLQVALSTGRNQVIITAISVHFVPGMRFLVIDFGLHRPLHALCDVRH